MAVLHDRCQHGVCAALEGTQCATSLSHLGISGGSSGVRAGGGGAAVLHVPGEPAEFDMGLRADSFRHPGLLVVRPEASASGVGIVKGYPLPSPSCVFRYL